MRVTFKSDATIGEVEFVEESSCRAFNESLLRVVKEIEFQPEVREGQPVTIKRQIEYQWARY